MQHQQLANGGWQKLEFVEQMANIGSEVERAMNWRQKNNKKFQQKAFERALELINLTLECQTNISRLKEVSRIKECLIDDFIFENQYQSTNQSWRSYFHAFNYAARTR